MYSVIVPSHFPFPVPKIPNPNSQLPTSQILRISLNLWPCDLWLVRIDFSSLFQGLVHRPILCVIEVDFRLYTLSSYYLSQDIERVRTSFTWRSSSKRRTRSSSSRVSGSMLSPYKLVFRLPKMKLALGQGLECQVSSVKCQVSIVNCRNSSGVCDWVLQVRFFG